MTLTFALSKDVSVTKSEDGMVLLDERNGRYFQLNPTGAYIVEALIGGSTADEVARQLAGRFAVAVEQAATDTAALMSALRDARLANR